MPLKVLAAIKGKSNGNEEGYVLLTFWFATFHIMRLVSERSSIELHYMYVADTAHYYDDASVDVGLFLKQLERLVLTRRIRPYPTALGRVAFTYFDGEAASRGDEPFRVVYLPNLQLTREGEPTWPNN